jgi:prophage DNA circulation protein
VPDLSQLRAASFRGKPFSVLDVSADGLARRVHTHEYPGRDEPYSEDLGAQTTGYSFEAFATWAQRDALVRACQAPGAGPLVHPVYGTVSVRCTSCTVSESTSSLGVSRFSLTFVRSGSNRFPAATENSGPRIELAAAASRLEMIESFIGHWTSDVPQWLTDATVGVVESLGAVIGSAASGVAVGSGLGPFSASLASMTGGAAGLVAEPTTLASTVSSTIRKLAALATDPLSSLRALEGVLSFDDALPAVTPSTRSRQIQLERRQALTRLVGGSAATEAVVTIARVALESYEQSAALRERLVALFDPEIDAAADSGEDRVSGALELIRREGIADLKRRGADLARVQTLTLSGSVPAVVLAYRLYGDPDRDAEIVSRNRITHPGYVPAGVALELLNA